MRIPHPDALPALAALAAIATLLGGCLFETKVAGGAEDFPNTLATLGSTTTESLSDHAEWDQFSNIPAITIQEAESLVAAPKPVTSGALAKAAKAAPPDTVFDLADTATLGVGRRYIRDAGPLRIRTDTAVFRWDDQARDSLRGNELILEMRGAEDWRTTERLTAYRYENTDSAGGFDRAAFYERVPKDKPAGSLQHKLIVVKPGPDGDFDAKADNLPVFSLTARTLGSDTLEAFTVADADGDGQLWGAGDSGLVDARRLQTDPALRPAVSRVVQSLRAIYFKQALKTYPVAFHETRTDRNGRKATFAIRGFRADSVFGPGDTVVVTARTVPGPGETTRFLEKTNRFRVLLSPTPWQFGRNQLLRFTLDVQWRPGAFQKGAVTGTRVTFTPDEPLASGDLTLAGDIVIEAEFSDGTTGTAEGRLEDKRIDVDLDELKAGLKLRRFRVRWDAAAGGEVLSQERLPN